MNNYNKTNMYTGAQGRRGRLGAGRTVMEAGDPDLLGENKRQKG